MKDIIIEGKIYENPEITYDGYKPIVRLDIKVIEFDKVLYDQRFYNFVVFYPVSLNAIKYKKRDYIKVSGYYNNIKSIYVINNIINMV